MFFRLVALNCRYTHSCLALYYLRAALAKHFGPACRIAIEERTINDPYYATLQAMVADLPDALFFSVSIWNATYVERLIRDIAQVKPELPIVVGGPQISFGVGLELAGLCTEVKGAVEGLDGNFFTDLAAGSLQPLYTAGRYETYPYPYREADFTTTLVNRSIYYEASRGCPFSCSYCLSSLGQGVLAKEVAVVRQELKQLLASRPKTLRFVDRTFNIRPERTLAIWQFLLEQPGETVFHFEIAPDRFTEGMLSFLQSVPMGRFRFEIGLQSTNPVTLREISRGMDLIQALANIRSLMTLERIHLHVDLILGLPYETEESFLASFDTVFASMLRNCSWRSSKSRSSRNSPVWQKPSNCSVLCFAVLQKKESIGRSFLIFCGTIGYDAATAFYPSIWFERRTASCATLSVAACPRTCPPPIPTGTGTNSSNAACFCIWADLPADTCICRKMEKAVSVSFRNGKMGYSGLISGSGCHLLKQKRIIQPIVHLPELCIIDEVSIRKICHKPHVVCPAPHDLRSRSIFCTPKYK
ncbi:MAG: radical SAM protein [Deltaproteobacteria bacterium]